MAAKELLGGRRSNTAAEAGLASVIILVVGSAVVFLILAVVQLGQIRSVEMSLQSFADALALAALSQVLEVGVEDNRVVLDDDLVQTLAESNSLKGDDYEVSEIVVTPDDNYDYVSVTVRKPFQGLISALKSRMLTATASANIRSLRRKTEDWPALMIVADASVPMGQPTSAAKGYVAQSIVVPPVRFIAFGPHETRWSLVLRSMNAYLDLRLPIATGLIVYAKEVLDVIAPGDVAAVRAALLKPCGAIDPVTPPAREPSFLSWALYKRKRCPSETADGGRYDGSNSMHEALRRAMKALILRGPATRREQRPTTVVMAGDQPIAPWDPRSLDPRNQAIAAAKELRESGTFGIPLFALHVSAREYAKCVNAGGICDFSLSSVQKLFQGAQRILLRKSADIREVLGLPGRFVGDFLMAIAGGAKSDGNDPKYYRKLDGESDKMAVVRELVDVACRVGPFIQDVGWGRRLRVFIASGDEASGEEVVVPEVKDTKQNAETHGFRVIVEKEKKEIALSMKSCRALGENMSKYLVVRGTRLRLASMR